LLQPKGLPMQSFRSSFWLIATLTFGAVAFAQTPPQTGAVAAAPAPPPMRMSIAGFADGTDVPLKYSAAGASTSPAITWASAPPGTVTFLLHMHDMEVARNHTTDDQVHWLVWNIPGSASELPEGVPMGATLSNGAYQISASGAVYRGPGAPATAPKH